MQNSDAPRGKKIGVILMTYGSATTAEHVREYMEHVYPSRIGSEGLEEIITDFENRYRLVGHSPLVEITQNQAKLLEEFLNTGKFSKDAGSCISKVDGGSHEASDSVANYVVRAGMLHSSPFIEEAMLDCRAAGAEQCIGIILSPQFSSFIMNGYRAAFDRAAERAGFSQDQIAVAGTWPTEPHFVSLLASRVIAALKTLREQYGENVPIVFTTHSLPQRVVEKDPSYLDQLKATTDAVIEKMQSMQNISMESESTNQISNTTTHGLLYFSGYQSAGHTPEEWLKPDLTDILAQIAKKSAEKNTDEQGRLKYGSAKAVLIVPIQFLADHLEILYDLDIAARKQCEDFGIAYHRIDLPNTAPLFIESLAAIAKSTLSSELLKKD